jgi:membrane protease YdiL (CAAX protease family)
MELGLKMKYKTTVNILIGLLIAVILFHIAVIVKVIPYDIAWGGRLQNDYEMYVFEAISILVNLFFGLALLVKGDYIKSRFYKTIDIILWVFLALFALNTVGNIFAKTLFEKSFAVLTLVFAILILKILKTKNNINTNKL